MHEEMITVHDCPNTIDCKNFYVIYSNQKEKNAGLLRLKGKVCPINFRYSSDQNKDFLNISQLKSLIKNVL